MNFVLYPRPFIRWKMSFRAVGIACLIVSLVSFLTAVFSPVHHSEPMNLIFGLTETKLTFYGNWEIIGFSIYALLAGVLLFMAVPGFVARGTSNKEILANLFLGGQAGLLGGLAANFFGGMGRVQNDFLIEFFAAPLVAFSGILAVSWGTYNAIALISGGNNSVYWGKAICFASGFGIISGLIIAWGSSFQISLLAIIPVVLMLAISAVIFLMVLPVKLVWKSAD